MQPSTKPSRDILTGIKVILASLSVAGVFGIGGMISARALQNQSPVDTSIDLSTLPTLESVVTLPTSQPVTFQPTGVPQPSLRSVNALPTQEAPAVQPQVKTVVIGVPSGKTSRASGAATRTRSS